MSAEKIAKVESTHLGREDHGIMTAYLHVTYGGSGQGLGGYCLDEPAGEGGERRRIGSAYGMEWIMRAIDACGVDTWEKIKGRTVIVYVEDDSWGARVLGFGPLPTEPGKPFMFDDLVAVASR